jgi:predicted transcriptional regulator
MKNAATAILTFRVSEELAEAVRHAARRENTSVSALLRRAVAEVEGFRQH